MSRFTIRKGLDLPITGEPEQTIEQAAQPARVALLAADYIGMKPTMYAQEGDEVKRGQLLFDDKKTPGVRYTAPAGGRVVGIHRGERRALESVVIELDQDELSGGGESVSFESFSGKAPAELSADEIKALLLESGVWTTLRQRPFSRVARPEETPAAIFVTAIDTNPLAADVEVALAGKEDDFSRGVEVLARLSDATVHVCKSASSGLRAPSVGNVAIEEFEGPHPAGAVGTHIHFLKPVDRNRVVWHINYQDVVMVGRLFGAGVLDVERVISLAGPSVERPRLLRTRIGASTDDLVRGELSEGEQRVVSGSVLSGRKCEGEIHGYLGRYHLQISVLREGREMELFGWLAPGAEKYSVINTFTSALNRAKKFAFTTSTNGSDRAIVPIGMYEKIMPLDILPTFMLKALSMRDLERAEELGVLELDEEDLALCSFVCPGKNDYGPMLRELLTTIEKEG